MQWYLKVLKNYAVFSGRARRKEYWMFVLFNTIFIFAASVLDTILFGVAIEGVGPLYGIYALALLIPSIAVSVRRLHDISRSGWWLLIILIPLVGPIILIIFTVRDSTPGANNYGDNPKEIA